MDTFIDRPDGRFRKLRIVLLKITFDTPLNRRRLERSNEGASGFEHRFKAGVHFFFFNELAPLGCRYSFFNGGKETGFFVEITSNNIRHQPFGGGPGLGGDLRKLRFLLGCEMYFHALQGTRKPRTRQQGKRCAGECRRQNAVNAVYDNSAPLATNFSWTRTGLPLHFSKSSRICCR